MHADATPVPLVRRLRYAAGIAGALMVALALVPELRHSGSPGLGTIQIALLALGVLALLVAWLGARFPAAYRATAVIMLNTILFLLALEPAAVIVSSIRRPAQSPPASQRYYAAKPWGARFIREQSDAMKQDYYRPFALWKRGRTTGESVNVDAEGIRRTPGARCGPGAYRVLMLGGSTMWGLGSPDSATIPAWMQAELAKRTTRPVCVVNLGEKGYTSTQELVLLITRLRSDDVPDLLLFYDGVNDVNVAAAQGEPGLHYGYREVADKLEGAPRPLGVRARNSRFLSLVLPSVSVPADSLRVMAYRERGINADSLAEQVVARYLEVHRAIRGLSREYGFDYAFFWQPVIWRGRKPLTEGERLDARKYAMRGLPELFDAVYSRMHEIAPREENLYDIADVFDGLTADIYIDWCHVIPEGNSLIVERMLAVLDKRSQGRWVPPASKAPPEAPAPRSTRAIAAPAR